MCTITLKDLLSTTLLARMHLLRMNKSAVHIHPIEMAIKLIIPMTCKVAVDLVTYTFGCLTNFVVSMSSNLGCGLGQLPSRPIISFIYITYGLIFNLKSSIQSSDATALLALWCCYHCYCYNYCCSGFGTLLCCCSTLLLPCSTILLLLLMPWLLLLSSSLLLVLLLHKMNLSHLSVRIHLLQMIHLRRWLSSLLYLDLPSTVGSITQYDLHDHPHDPPLPTDMVHLLMLCYSVNYHE